jgi:hypothetical protein
VIAILGPARLVFPERHIPLFRTDLSLRAALK